MTDALYKNLGWIVDAYNDIELEKLPILIRIYVYSYIVRKFMQKIIAMTEKYVEYGILTEVNGKF